MANLTSVDLGHVWIPDVKSSSPTYHLVTQKSRKTVVKGEREYVDVHIDVLTRCGKSVRWAQFTAFLPKPHAEKFAIRCSECEEATSGKA